MTSWQGARILFQYEMRRSWVGLLVTIAFSTYFSVVTMPIFTELLSSKESIHDYGWVGDLFYMTMLPAMCFFMHRSTLKSWNNNIYTRRIAYWRTMPIGITSIVMARMLQLLTVLLIVATFFFTIQYLFVAEIRNLMTPGQYIIFVLFWIGYALAVGSTYVIFEILVDGKTYFFICLGYAGVYLAISLVFWRTHSEIVVRSMEVAHNGEVLWPVCSLLIAFIVVAIASLTIRRKLETRNLLN
ncbi:hypothetical protein Back11_35200 [Paenibacillus baekrokdamisoli]|uniref:Uncharacterized protein n=1 Tax=Paenibacillus baekrokdamisoli TaxID=1712516 RepID=A0A3G9J1D1_9BACL|nr:hypothetical protein [Paenibacillus baekrokdamisoli]MBB3070887.1 hypothetical protein [Paenibacillus baekrokdamisoli]BBH22175.1 hypothetical protein Back11_35200 [Paenibacillus baekrokdamisoli]